MSKAVRGHVNERLEPLIRLTANSRDEDFLALVDTGFSGHLMMSQLIAERLGFRPDVLLDEMKSRAVLADGSAADYQVYAGTVNWMGQEREVEVWATLNGPAVVGDGRPEAMVGTRLVSPSLLKIDFDRGQLLISTTE